METPDVEYVVRHFLYTSHLVYLRRGIPNNYRLMDLFKEKEMQGPWTPTEILRAHHATLPPAVSGSPLSSSVPSSDVSGPASTNNSQSSNTQDGTLTLTVGEVDKIIQHEGKKATIQIKNDWSVFQQSINQQLSVEQTSMTNRIDELLLNKMNVPTTIDGSVLESLQKKQKLQDNQLAYVYSLFTSQITSMQNQLNLFNCLTTMDLCFPAPMACLLYTSDAADE